MSKDWTTLLIPLPLLPALTCLLSSLLVTSATPINFALDNTPPLIAYTSGASSLSSSSSETKGWWMILDGGDNGRNDSGQVTYSRFWRGNGMGGRKRGIYGLGRELEIETDERDGSEGSLNGVSHIKNLFYAAATLSFRGSAIYLIGSRSSFHGTLTTTLDGENSTILKHSQDLLLPREILFSRTGLVESDGEPHYLTITNMGPKEKFLTLNGISITFDDSIMPTPPNLSNITHSPTFVKRHGIHRLAKRSGGGSSEIGPIVGGVLGGIAVLSLTVLAIVFLFLKRKPLRLTGGAPQAVKGDPEVNAEAKLTPSSFKNKRTKKDEGKPMAYREYVKWHQEKARRLLAESATTMTTTATGTATTGTVGTGIESWGGSRDQSGGGPTRWDGEILEQKEIKEEKNAVAAGSSLPAEPEKVHQQRERSQSLNPNHRGPGLHGLHNGSRERSRERHNSDPSAARAHRGHSRDRDYQTSGHHHGSHQNSSVPVRVGTSGPNSPPREHKIPRKPPPALSGERGNISNTKRSVSTSSTSSAPERPPRNPQRTLSDAVKWRGFPEVQAEESGGPDSYEAFDMRTVCRGGPGTET